MTNEMGLNSCVSQYTGEIMQKMGPLAEDHPLVGDKCPACKKEFEANQYVTLVTLGPGDDEENRKKAREGRAYAAAAMPVHWACATGKE